MRIWHKTIPPKKANELAPLYRGTWMPQLDRSWESEDGYNVMSRKIKTAWGPVEHVTIHNTRGKGDVPWSVKQEIKDELFGFKSVAIEVFPSKKNLVDVCDVYHLWVLPKDFVMPFGIHPFKDVQCEPMERGYDFNVADCQKWNDSPIRAELMAERELSEEQLKRVEQMKGLLDGKKV